jgi:response regulator of citrate/malate metabolism
VIRVLIVDDETRAADAHGDALSRIDGFEHAGTAFTVAEAHRAILAAVDAGDPIDLVLLDLTLPDGDGLDLVHTLRAARIDVDFIAITAVRQIESVQAALAVGAVQYLIKPFGFPVFREKLEQYARYRERVSRTLGASTQNDVDDLIATWRPASRSSLPKGLSSTTLDAVSTHLRSLLEPRSASEVAAELDLSRVTARRYLEHLADLGLATRTQRYGSPGRPEVQYSWRSAL